MVLPPLLLFLLLLGQIAGSGAYEYRAEGQWYLPVQHEGRLDLYGLEALRLQNSEVLPSDCTETDLPSLLLWLRGRNGCAQLLQQHALTLQCVVQSYPTTQQPAVQFTCDSPSALPHHNLQLKMSCSNYQFPTNKIKDARSCRFSLNVTFPAAAMELAFHLTAAIFVVLEVSVFFVQWVQCRSPSARLLALSLAANISYLPLLLFGLLFHNSVLPLGILFFIWYFALALKVVLLMRWHKLSQKQNSVRWFSKQK